MLQEWLNLPEHRRGNFAERYRRITVGDWDYRLDIRTGDELEMLAQRFNGMTEKLGKVYRSLEGQVAERTRKITDQLSDLSMLLETSTQLSSTLDIEKLLPLLAERLTYAIKTTYCRIALIDDDNPNPVIRAAYPIRMIDWEPGIGGALELTQYGVLSRTFKTNSYIILSAEEINHPEFAAQKKHLLSPETTSAIIIPIVIEGRPQGVIILGEVRQWEREPISKEKLSLCQTMANQVAVAIANAQNYTNLHEMLFATVKAMVSAIDAKSPWTRGHSERVTHHAVEIGKRLNLDSDSLVNLQLGCLLHDIGKIGTLEAILDKPGPLTDEEFALVKQHPAKGEEILNHFRQFKPILPVIRHHHEWYNGSGYPDGLEGEGTPLLARIAAIADSYDSMTADRPYRKAPGREKAISEFHRCSGTQFDPSIAKVFVLMLEQGYQ